VFSLPPAKSWMAFQLQCGARIEHVLHNTEATRLNLHIICFETLAVALLFVQSFVTKFYTVDEENYPNEAGIVNNLANAMLVSIGM